MTNSLPLIVVSFLLNMPVHAGTVLDQLPGGGELAASRSAKAPSDWLSFSVRQSGRSGFYMDDFRQGISVSGYKDFEGDMRFSGRVGDEMVSGRFEKDYSGQGFTFEFGDIALKVKRHAIHYKVTGFAKGAGGAMLPVDLLVKGGIRGNSYMLDTAGLQLTASEESMSGSLSGGVYDKKFAAAMAALLASLQTDDIFCVLERAYNYPNPFQQGNGTTLSYKLMQNADYVKVTVYSAYGKVLADLQGGAAKGDNQVFWDGRSSEPSEVGGRKIFFWQMEIFFRGESEKIIKQFRMDGR